LIPVHLLREPRYESVQVRPTFGVVEVKQTSNRPPKNNDRDKHEKLQVPDPKNHLL
jgi:hypothetical protein